MVVNRNIMFAKAGGNASKNACTYRLNIPADMVRGLGVTEDDRAVTLTFDGEKIIVEKSK